MRHIMAAVYFINWQVGGGGLTFQLLLHCVERRPEGLHQVHQRVLRGPSRRALQQEEGCVRRRFAVHPTL